MILSAVALFVCDFDDTPNGSESHMFGLAQNPANGRPFSQKCEKFGFFLRNPRKKFNFRLELSEKIGMVIG